jgi:sporulation protein YlmC with PRC-barrel domain
MRIDLGAKVRTRDGHGAGHVKQAVWDPAGNRIVAYVINTGGLLGHDAVIPPESVEGAERDGDEIVLNLTKKELGEIARYEESEYSVPPEDWIPPAVFGFPTSGYLWPVRYTESALPPVGPPPPTEHVHEPAIRRGMRVRDANGDDLGTVEEVMVDEATEELRGIVVRRGGVLERVAGDGQTFEIDVQQVGQVDDDELRLITSGAEILGRQRA